MKAFLTLILFSFHLLCSAANIEWASSTSHNWHIGANWVGGNVPGVGDVAVFNGGDSVAISTTVQVGGIVTLGILHVTSTGNLTVLNGNIVFSDNLGPRTSSSFGTIVLVGGTFDLASGASFLNNVGASLNINMASNLGLNLGGSFLNRSGANLFVSQCPTGIANIGLLDNRGYIEVFNNTIGLLAGGTTTNSGTIRAFNNAANGIEVTGTFTNTHRIITESNTSYGLYHSNGHFANETGAKMVLKDGLESADFFENKGKITTYRTGGVGLLISGEFLNTDTLCLGMLNRNGMRVIGTMENRGYIGKDTVSINPPEIRYLIRNDGKIFNHETIDIDGLNLFNGIFLNTQTDTSKYLKNYGTIKIKHTDSLAINGQGYFYNYASGYLDIDSCSTGIYLNSFAENMGHIELKNGSGYAGLLLDNGATFLNKSSGEIAITNAGFWQLVNKGTITNQGSWSSVSGLSQNNMINIYTTTIFGIIYNESHWKNLGGQGSFVNQALIENRVCGSWVNEAPFTMQTSVSSSTFRNFGVFIQQGEALITPFGTALRNYGVFTSDKRIYAENTFWLQEGLVFYPLADKKLMGATYPISFSNKSSDLSISTTWYSDENLTQVAGTFNPTLGTFTLNSTASFDKLWFSVTKTGESCSLKTSLAFLESFPTCQSTSVIQFNGGVSYAWMNRQNWENSRLPSACDKAQIPANKKVELETLERVSTGNFITLEGAVVDLKAGSVFYSRGL